MNSPDPTGSRSLRFASALLAGQWQDDVVIRVGNDGRIVSIDADDKVSVVDEDFDMVALPGMVNVHSHAFQRAFAGLSEFRTAASQDNFWTWRRLMFDFLRQLTPDDVYIIARQLYLEMLLAGYTWVGEFHYLHNQIDGRPYANESEMADAIIRAASDTGIGLCMLPVLYQRAGFDNSALEGGQLRFELSNERFLRLYEKLLRVEQPNYVAGVSVHSLRAVGVDAAREAITAAQHSIPECRIHIHVAEQTAEVEDCLQHHGQRSVEFLLNHFDVDDKWCLIHATHSDAAEVEAIARSGAVVGLCPTTESNLGDGYFSAREYFDAGGAMAIGGDSHCCVDPRDELRTLEYGQRLQRRQRAVLGSNTQSVGGQLYQRAVGGGAHAIGIETGVLQVGTRADITLVDPNHPAIAGARGDALIDRMIFCNADDPIIGSIVGGVIHSMDDPAFQELVFDSQLAFTELSRRLIGSTTKSG